MVPTRLGSRMVPFRLGIRMVHFNSYERRVTPTQAAAYIAKRIPGGATSKFQLGLHANSNKA